MSTARKVLESLPERCREVVEALKADPEVGPDVDDTLPPPQPFVGRGEVRLVILGQDPTVRRKASRKKITVVLNLNKPGALRTYLGKVCAGLRLSLDEHIYATNVCRNFFVDPPANTPGLLEKASPYWFPLLKEELALFPGAAVISLGQPVLEVLIHPEHYHCMRYFWGHHPRWQEGVRQDLHSVAPEESTIGRQIFPFVHYGSRTKQFYAKRRPDYLAFVREQMEQDKS